MKRTLLLFAIPALGILIGCQGGDSTVGPDDTAVVGPRFHHNPGHDKGGGGDGSNTQVEFSLSGGYDTDPALQSAVIVSNNKNRMQIEGGGGCEPAFGCKDMALTFADKVSACLRDPADLDDAHVDDLLAQLSDPVQNRTFYADIEKRGRPVSSVHVIYHEDGSVGSHKYRTQLYDASASEGQTDVLTLTGGTVWILKEGFGSISCQFTGEGLVLTVVR